MMIIIIHKVMMMIMEMVMIETVEMMDPAQMVERVAAHHAFLRQQSNALPDLRFLLSIFKNWLSSSPPLVPPCPQNHDDDHQ